MSSRASSAVLYAPRYLLYASQQLLYMPQELLCDIFSVAWSAVQSKGLLVIVNASLMLSRAAKAASQLRYWACMMRTYKHQVTLPPMVMKALFFWACPTSSAEVPHSMQHM